MTATNGTRDHFINQNIEINIAGSTTLDNGITAGVNIWLDGNTGTILADDISETRVSLGGAFGTLTLGSFESAAQLGTIWAPGGNGNFGIKSPFFGVGNGACRGNPGCWRVRGFVQDQLRFAVLQWHLAQRQL